jgi:hypothetical protein
MERSVTPNDLFEMNALTTTHIAALPFSLTHTLKTYEIRHTNTLLENSVTYKKRSGAGVWHDIRVTRGERSSMFIELHGHIPCARARVPDIGPALSIKIRGTHCALLYMDVRAGERRRN